MPEEAEKQLMDLLRSDNFSSFRLTIKRIKEVWDVELSVPPHDPRRSRRWIDVRAGVAWR